MIGGDVVGLQNTMRALADPTRRTILNLLKKRRLSAGEIAEHFNISLPAISKHLSILKEADLIRDQREGKYIFYELNASVLEEENDEEVICALLWSYLVVYRRYGNTPYIYAGYHTSPLQFCW